MNSNNLYFPISGLINAITSIVLGIFVLSKNKNNIKHITFALFCLSIAIWGSFYFVCFVTDSAKISLFCAHGLMFGAILVPGFYLHHIFALTGQNLSKKKVIISAYILTLVLFIFNLTPYYITGVQPRLLFKYWPTPGPLFLVF